MSDLPPPPSSQSGVNPYSKSAQTSSSLQNFNYAPNMGLNQGLSPTSTASFAQQSTTYQPTSNVPTYSSTTDYGSSQQNAFAPNSYQQPTQQPNSYAQPPQTSFQPQSTPQQVARPGDPVGTVPQPVQYTPLQSISSGSANPSSQSSSKPGSSPRINPKQIPSPTTMDHNRITKYNTSTNQTPPSVCAPFLAIDDGNCNPRYMRSTLYTVPITSDLLSTSKIPFGVLIQPLAEPAPGEEAIPIVDMGATGPLRCQRCRAYINPFITFVDNGRSYACKFCEFVNEIPKDYYSPLEVTGRRYDHNSRLELSRATVEFITTAEYISKPPKPLSYLFAIDVSYNAISTGTVKMVTETIKKLLASFAETSSTKFGFMTFDTSVHFYNVNVIFHL